MDDRLDALFFFSTDEKSSSDVIVEAFEPNSHFELECCAVEEKMCWRFSLSETLFIERLAIEELTGTATHTFLLIFKLPLKFEGNDLEIWGVMLWPFPRLIVLELASSLCLRLKFGGNDVEIWGTDHCTIDEVASVFRLLLLLRNKFAVDEVDI